MNKIDFINGTRGNTTKNLSIKLGKFTRIINNLKRRIFVAKQQGRFRIMRKLQKLLITAHSNRLVAVQQVCKIKVRDSNLDLSNIIFLSEQSCFIKKLKEINLHKGRPMVKKLIYSPKFTHKLQDNSIDIFINEALQIIIKNALEPEWEPIFQPSCEKLRGKQSPKDVIKAIHYLYKTQSRNNWIVKLNIKKSLNCISKEFLDNLLHSFPAKKMIQSWFNVRGHNLSFLNREDNIIRILFGNIILNDIKKVLRLSNKNTIIHYNNEFLVTCKTKEDALKIKEEINLLLNSRRLFIEKAHIKNIMEGFNFLGFNIRLYNNNKYRKKNLIIQPSNKYVFKMKNKLKKMWIKSNGFPVRKIIKTFNPMIRRWADYFKIGNSSKIFKLLDQFMYRRQLRFTRKAHSRKSLKWIEQRYWRFLFFGHQKKRVFGCKETGAYMLKFTWMKNPRYFLN